jgi:hypothetical protein
MNFLKRLWKLRFLRVLVYIAGSLLTLYFLLWAVANYWGARRWAQAEDLVKREGEKLELRALVPDPVPEDKNFCAIPALRDLVMVVDNDPDKGEPGAKRKRLQDAALPSGKDRQVGIRPPQAKGAAFGTPTDLKAWADWLRKEGSLPMPPDSGDAARDVLAALAKHEDVYAALTEGANRPEARWFPEWKARSLPDNLFSIMVPEYQAAQAVGGTLSLRAIALARAGEAAKAHETIRVELALARASLSDPILIGTLVGITQHSMTLGDIWELCEAHAGSAEDFRSLQEALSKFDFRGDLLTTCRGELACSIGTLRWMKRMGGSQLLAALSVVDTPGGWEPGWIERAFWSAIPSGWLDANMATIVDLEFNHIIKPLRDQGFRAALDEGLSLDTDLKRRKARFQIDSILACLMLPATTKVNSRTTYIDCLNNQAMIACALERWYAEHKSYPDSLDELKRDGEKPLPGDPLNGGPMHYRKTPDGRYTLWCAGFDGKDDGGKRDLDPKKPDNTKFGELGYKGDWVWSYQPGE